MKRDKAIEIARAVLSDGPTSRADVMALALFVLLEANQTHPPDQGFEGAFSPSAPWIGGGASPAAPETSPVSKEHVAASSARHLGSPSGVFPKEADTQTDLGKAETNTATLPTMVPTSAMAWQDEQIALWLEEHATGYEHGGHYDIARTHRKRARQIRRREYLERSG